VEHPVTELVYGVDLVREQLRVAAGHPMRVHGGALLPRGHAIECRITAEDPFDGFLPATGVIGFLRVPGGPGVRWDGGIETGTEVTAHYDPLLAKLIVWGETREVAIARMTRALRELMIVGVPTSQPFHLRVMEEPAFRRGEYDITYVERLGDALLAFDAPPDLARMLAVAGALLTDGRRGVPPVPRERSAASGPSPWLQAGWRDGMRE